MNLSTLIAALASLVAITLVVQLFRQRKRSRGLEDTLRAVTTAKETLERESAASISNLRAENERLAPFRSVADASVRAAELIREAEQSAQKLMDGAREQVERLISETQAGTEAAEAEAQGLLGEARQTLREAREKSQSQLDSSTLQAAKIVEDANTRATEIAGKALEARDKAELYERSVKALKNTIDGYGDAYIVPAHSILDDLATEFGFTEAGETLRKARERTKYMIRNNTAAACAYVEASRRDTAIRFVLDAFNGKVDSILSRVRSDNFGTLQQEIRDAFALVNLNGSAFRDARISEEYLLARIEELKWGSVAQELKLQERDEQRKVKEQLREEEKARREYEKAIREAAKEEDMLHKAMQKAQAAIEKAGADQKSIYEQQLADLQQRLREAEDRNRRALSMAQQTKRGHVYIISNIGSFGDDVYKVGLTRRLEPLDRVRELGDSSVPFEFDVHALILSDDAPALEAKLHRHFVMRQINKVNHRKEFFRASLAEIRAETEALGLSCKWTMTANAKEWRETRAIERAIQDDPKAREAWVKRQLEAEDFEHFLEEQLSSESVEPAEGGAR